MPVHRLAWKLALTVAGATAVLAAGGRLAGAEGGLGAGLGAAVVLGGVAYVATRHLVTRRLEAARALLTQFRRLEFEALSEVPEDRREEHLPAAEAPSTETPAEAPRDEERHSDEDELDELLVDIRRTGRALAAELRELRKMENYRREFIGNVSHELKTPIFSIRGFSETLLDGALEDKSVRRSFVEKIMRNADRLRHLASDLAEIARIETGELKMTVSAFPLRPLVREVIESLEPVASEKDVALQERLPERLPAVEGDRERLRQVLTNLVDNAIKYNEAGGSIEVAARQVPSGAVKTYVVDDGIGVAPEHIARLTERFYRVDQSRSRSQGGTGLGLAIVKHILGAHGSELTVSSSPDHGSTFGFTLPAAPEASEVEEAENAPRKDGDRALQGRSDRTATTPAPHAGEAAL